MMVIMDAIRQISALRPAELPAVPTPRMPDVSSVHELARITDGTPEKILRAVDSLRADSAQIEKLQREARQLAFGCIRDLFALGLRLLQEAVPMALGLLIPNPAAQMAARAALQGLAMRGLAEAGQRIMQLVHELIPLARPLLEIAGRAVASAVGEEGHVAKDSLKSEQSRALPGAPAPSTTPEMRWKTPPLAVVHVRPPAAPAVPRKVRPPSTRRCHKSALRIPGAAPAPVATTALD